MFGDRRGGMFIREREWMLGKGGEIAHKVSERQ